jgi:hypothetical protein
MSLPDSNNTDHGFPYLADSLHYHADHLNIRSSSQFSDLSLSASMDGSHQMMSTNVPRQGGDSTPFKVPSFPSISSINRPTRSADENDSSLQGIGESSPRLSQFFHPTQESPPQIASSPRAHDVLDPVALARPSPPPPERISKYTPLAVIEAQERQRREEEAAAEAKRRKEQEDSFSAVPEQVLRKLANEDRAHEIFEKLRSVKIQAKGRGKPGCDSQFDDLFFGTKSRVDPDGVRRVIKSVSEKGQESDDETSVTDIRRRASTAPVKKKGSMSTVISNSQPSNGSLPQNEDTSGSNGTTGTIIKETTLESTPGSRPQTAGGGAGIDSSQFLEQWNGSMDVITPLRMSKPLTNIPSSTRSVSRQAMETPAVKRSLENSEESVPETSPVKEDGAESGEYRTAQESFQVDEIVDSSPVVVVHGRKRSHNGFVASSIPSDASQRKRDRPPIIQDDVSDEDIPDPPQLPEVLPSPPRKRRRTRTRTFESTELLPSHAASPSVASVAELDSPVHRVLALFQDTKRNYYPATVMEPPTILSADQEVPLDTEVVVRFDDGMETTVKLRYIRRFQIQEGDEVKLAIPGAKNASFLVKGCEADPTQDGKTDIDGNNIVVVTSKARGSTEERRVAIDQIFVTPRLFAQFLSRCYTFTKDPSARSKYVPTIVSRQVLSTPRIVRPIRKVSTIFQNMVFAMTVINLDMKEREELTRAVRMHGGHIVDEGLEDLFHAPDDVNGELILLPQWESTTFCGVIADGYSRKPKYLQALALGLPCLSSRWIENCIKRVCFLLNIH